MKKIIKKGVLVAVLALGSYLSAHAQPEDGDPDGDPDLIPLDPGSWVLVAAGVGYGVKKWRDMKVENKKNGEQGNFSPGEKAGDNTDSIM